MNKTILIAGYSGVNGYAVTKHFENKKDWNVQTLSRKDAGYDFDARHLYADLEDLSSLEQHESALAEVTHVFYAALKKQDDPAQEAAENGRMFSNLIKTVDRVSENLQHVSFLQGGKVYGAHLGVYKTPAKESDSRHFPPNLYFEHEDFIKSYSADKAWSYTALRPDVVLGHSLGSAMNLGNLIGYYASLCQHMGLDLHFPGSADAYEVLVNVTDADLVAQSTEWSFSNPDARNEAFNITNGDIFRWKHVWPQIASYFNLKPAEPQPFPIQTFMDANESVWKEVVAKHQLEDTTLDQLGKGSFGDFIFNVEKDAIFDVNKARRTGFNVMNKNSALSFIHHFEQMKKKNLIPS